MQRKNTTWRTEEFQAALIEGHRETRNVDLKNPTRGNEDENSNNYFGFAFAGGWVWGRVIERQG